MRPKIKRISAALNKDLYEKLKKAANKEDKAVSEVLRDAINLYLTVKSYEVDIKDVELYSNFIASGENVIVDTETWITILGEINRCASDLFWENIRQIGREQGAEFKVKGIKNLRDVLEFLEAKKLYTLKLENNVYTLILTARPEQRFLKEFILGLCEELGIKVEIVEGVRKLVIAEIK
ncbi:ribbon-helix-helix protein, CopG family [Archaeoglobus sp.]